jgi:ornithine cyclodeaminase/alanine dehydrogenase-like protein (mu-crystallin family)
MASDLSPWILHPGRSFDGSSADRKGCRERYLEVDAIRLVEDGLRQHAMREATVLPRLSLDLPGEGGAFRVMAASMPKMCYFGLKTLTGYPGKRDSRETYFVLLLFSGIRGALRSIMAARHLSGIRTGAASAVAAKHLARRNGSVLGLFSAGVQARFQVEGILAVFPLRRIKVFDIDGEKARTFAEALEKDFSVEAWACSSPLETVVGSDVVVTATTAREPAFRGEWLEPGTHASGIGSNSPAKQELDALTFKRSKIVVDFKDQVLTEAGDLMSALKTGVIRKEDIHAELGEIVAGAKPGRCREDEITLFKSVGTAVQDIATASFVYQQAVARGIGQELSFEG